jgi:hypothetical protein
MKTFTFYEDPGHGWLEVDKADLKDLGVTDKVSGYSYVKGTSVYLEEDSDMWVFMDAFKSKYGDYPQRVTVYQETTPIRRYREYR